MPGHNNEILVAGAAHDGNSYDQSSQTQRAQGEYLLSLIPADLPESPRVADIGCGNGRTTLDISRGLPVDAAVYASDISDTQIAVANANLESLRQSPDTTLPAAITFYVADALDIGSAPETQGLDLVFSNAALHWVTDGREMYGRIFDALADEGEIVIQQGGKDCYAGLADLALTAAQEVGAGEAFTDWKYPLFYPSQDEMTSILGAVGFSEVTVESLESDGKQYPELYKNYADAGILPFLERAGDKADALRSRYLELAAEQQQNGVLDSYTHRLVITATK